MVPAPPSAAGPGRGNRPLMVSDYEAAFVTDDCKTILYGPKRISVSGSSRYIDLRSAGAPLISAPFLEPKSKKL
jgi:hypothetical protein